LKENKTSIRFIFPHRSSSYLVILYGLVIAGAIYLEGHVKGVA